jgi:hypothetical protein
LAFDHLNEWISTNKQREETMNNNTGSWFGVSLGFGHHVMDQGVKVCGNQQKTTLTAFRMTDELFIPN